MDSRDWKKLTFYYFADSYINFNSLVTDLFKIYKTRIWMSAINPASFVTPAPSAMSNPLYSQEVDRRHDGRYNGRDEGREGMPNPISMTRRTFTDSYQPDAFGPYSPTSYGPLETGFSDYNAVGNGAARMHPSQGEWVGRFQGLSLNS